MKPLIDEQDKTAYSAGQYSLLGQLRFHNKLNMESFTDRSYMENFRVPNQHILVNLLRLLTINTDWSEEALIIRLESNADRLASLLNFNCTHNNGVVHKNVFYKEGYNEFLVILPPQYDPMVMMKQPLLSLTPIIPIHDNSTDYGFVPVPDRNNPEGGASGGVGVIGVDIVQLGIGYYRYLKDLEANNRTLGYDPQSYLNKFPFINATAIHNDMAIMNAVYSRLTSQTELKDMLDMDPSKFTTFNNSKATRDYAEWCYNQLTNRQLTNGNHVLSIISTAFPRGNARRIPLFGEYMYLKRISWVYQLATIKPLTILLKANSINGFKTGSVNDTISKWGIFMKRSVEDFCPKGFFKTHVHAYVDTLLEANKENYK